MLSDIDSLIQQSSQLEAEIRIVLAETNRKFTEIVGVGGRVSSRYGALGGAMHQAARRATDVNIARVGCRTRIPTYAENQAMNGG